MMPEVVYVRSATRADFDSQNIEFREGTYAICDSEGGQLALTNESAVAFDLARQHGYTPVWAH